MIDALQGALAALLILGGSLFALTAAIGLVRLPDLYTRMHAASKAGTLGSCVMLVALAVYADDPAVALRALGGVAFFLLTAPVSAHLLAKAAHASGLQLWRDSVRDDYTADGKPASPPAANIER
jgi:multicomponent Na+:H+ antiporter subunit G